MPTIKKLLFAPFFLVSFSYLCFLLPGFIKSSASVLSLSVESLVSFLLITVLILITSFFFVLLVTLTQDWKLVLPVMLLGILPPFVFLTPPFSIYLTIGTFFSLLIILVVLSSKLKNYLTFQPGVLLSPPIRNLATLLAIVISITYFLSIQIEIKQKGLEIPDSLIEQTLKIAPPAENSTPQLTDQQKQILDQAKKNPDLLKGTGYTLKDLEAIEQAASGNNTQALNSTVKETIKTQFQTLVKPYESIVAPSLAILAFFTLTSLISLLAILIPMLLWLTFYILKTSKFIKFQTGIREVKKLVV